MTLPRAALDDAKVTKVPRKFTILAAMIFVAVTGIGLAWDRQSMNDFVFDNSAYRRRPETSKLFNIMAWNALPYLILWSLAGSLLGFRAAREPVREMVKRSGRPASARRLGVSGTGTGRADPEPIPDLRALGG